MVQLISLAFNSLFYQNFTKIINFSRLQALEFGGIAIKEVIDLIKVIFKEVDEVILGNILLLITQHYLAKKAL